MTSAFTCMKNSRPGCPKGCPLQLAPIPLKRLLSETNSPQLERPNSKPLQLEGPNSKPPQLEEANSEPPQLEGPNSKPLQLERLKLDSCSEPKENELTLYDPKAVSQLESISLLRLYELNRVSQLEVISVRPVCQLASISLVTP